MPKSTILHDSCDATTRTKEIHQKGTFHFDFGTGRKLTKATPIRLPRCAHLLHRGCLEICLNHANASLKPLKCPICAAPLERPAPASAPASAPAAAPVVIDLADAPDVPVVGDFARARPRGGG